MARRAAAVGGGTLLSRALVGAALLSFLLATGALAQRGAADDGTGGVGPRGQAGQTKPAPNAEAKERKAALQEAQSLQQQGQAAVEAGRVADAEPLIKRALELREKALGSDAPAVAQSLNELGLIYRLEARYGEAAPLLARALDIREKSFGPDHQSVAQTVNQIAALYGAEGRYAEAEPLRERALAIAETAFGPDDARTGSFAANLAELYRIEGRYREAEPLVARALAIQDKNPDTVRDAEGLHVVALLYQAQGRYGDAEALVKRALAIEEKEHGPDHPAVASVLNTLALLDDARGRYAEAEPLLKRALAIRETALGPDHPTVAKTIDDLAGLYRTEGRFADAEALAKRALAIREKTLGPDHPAIAISLNTLASLFVAQRRFADAEPLYQRALAIREKAYGPDHRLVAGTLLNLALLYKARNAKPERIEPLVKRALAIQEKALGPNHPDIARSLDLLGQIERETGRTAEAEAALKRALANREAALGPDHPSLALTLDQLALVYEAQGDADRALAHSTRAIAILTRHADTETADQPLADTTEGRRHRGAFLLNITLAEESAAKAPDRRAAMVGDTFRSAQLAQSSSAAAALAGMAARFGSGDDTLGKLIRERQDVVEQWKKLDAALVQSLSRAGDQQAEAALKSDLAAATQRLQAIDQQIAHDFPTYAELSNAQPVSLDATQALLHSDEALLVYIVGAKQSWLWAVRRDRRELYDVALSGRDLVVAVQELRANLDPLINPDIRSFPATKAYELYRKILAPAAPLLAGARHVMIVPDGALQSLPVGVLVTKPPAHDPDALADHRAIAWLARDYAVTVLPAVSSLKALRQFAARSKATSPFLGIGDPVLTGKGGGTRGVANLATLFKGNLADTDKVRALPRLPETADELRTVARALDAADNSLYLEERASEPMLRKAELDHYRVIEFATHALMSGELGGLSEPALVLTPPATATDDNDGLLTASKIARLKLDADWVVLSACNTAASDGTPGADGLSGLAKAFFYAGSRALLVSNWSIVSKAAVKLTTGAFAEMAKDPSIGRAEALRRSEMALLDDTTLPAAYAHPMLWAPFTLAGEGGAGQ